MNPFDTTPTNSQRAAPAQTSWHAIADPPTPDATSAPGAGWAPSSPSSPADASTPRRRGGRGVRTVLAACLLSAVLASASTTALLSVAFGGSQPASAAATANAVVAASRTDPGDITAVVAAARPSVVTISFRRKGERRVLGEHRFLTYAGLTARRYHGNLRGGGKLGPGRYTATFVARDSDGVHSAPVRRAFRIMRPLSDSK